MRKIFAEINGGVGNQLFQYAAAYALAKRWKMDLRLDVRCPPSGCGLYYQYRLDAFNVSVRPKMSRSLQGRKIANSLRKRAVKLLRCARNFSDIIFLDEQVAYHMDVRFFRSPPLEKTVYLEGWWQSPLYFEDSAEDIRREFSFKDALSGKNEDMCRHIKNVPAAVSLHIRRGDYLTIPGAPVLPLSYYYEAIEQIGQRVKEPTFFVFSDDLLWAKENLPRSKSFIFVDINGVNSAHEDLRLMSVCRHHIIANSSFSWWGAWLNPKNDKVVIAPKYWLMGEGSYYADLFPCGWILMDNLNSKL